VLLPHSHVPALAGGHEHRVKSWASVTAQPQSGVERQAQLPVPGSAPSGSLSKGTHLEGKLGRELLPSPTSSRQSTLRFKAESLQ